MGVLVTLVIVFLTFAASVHVLILFLVGRPEKFDAVAQSWAWTLLRLSRASIQSEGLNKVPKQSVLFLFNHTSHFDIPILYAILPPRLRFGAKIELFRIPIFGRAIERAGTLPIARGEIEKVRAVYNQAAKRAQREHLNYALAPEGTRQTREGLGAFKTGPFMLAIEAGIPIVPVVIVGAWGILPKTSWFVDRKNEHQVRLSVLEPIVTKGLQQEARHRLRDQVRALMAAEFERLQSAR